jgi:hypothetical protein
MVYQRQGQRSTQNYLQRKKCKESYINAKADDQLKIIYNGKNINNGIPTPRPTINSKLSTTEKI